MTRQRSRSLLLALLCVITLQACKIDAAVTVTAQLDMTSQVALGNVFVTAAAEQVTLRVGTTVTVSGAGALPYYNNTGVGLAWNVTDFFGAVRASGTVERLPSGTVVRELKPLARRRARPPASSCSTCASWTGTTPTRCCSPTSPPLPCCGCVRHVWPSHH
jgi:hypothetical protein